jgi:cellulose synthase/poly-beta-1,6-N-acetylglucosamine synthase-like glycosyltransferase
MISVIIPTYNAEKTIGKCLRALLKQNYPKRKYEIIVVDDGSTDKTEQVVKKFRSVKFFKQKHRGPAAARNTGAKFSKGNIILFTDSDCVPSKDWIKHMVEPFKDRNVAGVSGTYKTLNKNSLLARFIGYDIKFKHEYMKKMKAIDFVGTFSAGYRKSVFQKEGGFDTSFPIASGEDPELSYRIAKKHKIVFQPSAFVWHPHPDNLIIFLKQKFWRVYWRYLMYSKHKEKIFGDSYTPFLSVISTLVQIFLLVLVCTFMILSFFIQIQIQLLILLLLFTIFIPNINFSLWVFKYDKKVAMVSPFIFFLRNIAFALGILVGGVNYLLKKLSR